MSLFDENNEQDTTPVEPTKIENAEQLATTLAEIKNDKGEAKYGSLEVALAALKESQSYIPTLKQEKEAAEAALKEANDKLGKSESVEEVVARLLEKSKPEEPTHQQEHKGIDENDVATLIERKLLETEKEKVYRANEDKVTKALTEQFGEKAKEEIAKKAAELGMTPTKLGELATESPQAVISLFNITQKQTPTPTESDVDTSFFQQKKEENKLEAPEKSVLSGSTSREQKEYMQKIKEHTYKKLGVEV